MPSKSYKNFHNNLKDIERLIENYNTLKGTNKGRKALDHITRSGILLLVASWEIYIEEVLSESVEIVTKKIKNPVLLPKEVQKKLSKIVDEHKNEIKAFELAGEGWKTVYNDSVKNEVNALNTPKKEKIDILFSNYLGINTMSKNWTKTSGPDFIIQTRGAIAHRVKSDKYVRMIILEGFIAEICQFVKETEECLYSHLSKLTGKTPWNYTY